MCEALDCWWHRLPTGKLQLWTACSTDEVRRMTMEPRFPAIVQTRHFSLFSHADEADAKKILSAAP